MQVQVVDSSFRSRGPARAATSVRPSRRRLLANPPGAAKVIRSPEVVGDDNGQFDGTEEGC